MGTVIDPPLPPAALTIAAEVVVSVCPAEISTTRCWVPPPPPPPTAPPAEVMIRMGWLEEKRIFCGAPPIPALAMAGMRMLFVEFAGTIPWPPAAPQRMATGAFGALAVRMAPGARSCAFPVEEVDEGTTIL